MILNVRKQGSWVQNYLFAAGSVDSFSNLEADINHKVIAAFCSEPKSGNGFESVFKAIDR